MFDVYNIETFAKKFKNMSNFFFLAQSILLRFHIYIIKYSLNRVDM